MELQFFHRPSSESLQGTMQRIALTIFVQRSFSDNEAFEPILSALYNIDFPGDSIFPAASFVLEPLLPKEKNFYVYQGSYPFPPCMEEVTWVIMTEPIAISESQLRRFRAIYATSPLMENNFRPIQPIHDRPLFTKCLIRPTPPPQYPEHNQKQQVIPKPKNVPQSGPKNGPKNGPQSGPQSDQAALNSANNFQSKNDEKSTWGPPTTTLPKSTPKWTYPRFPRNSASPSPFLINFNSRLCAILLFAFYTFYFSN